MQQLIELPIRLKNVRSTLVLLRAFFVVVQGWYFWRSNFLSSSFRFQIGGSAVGGCLASCGAVIKGASSHFANRNHLRRYFLTVLFDGLD